jgi:hypothetical protein
VIPRAPGATNDEELLGAQRSGPGRRLLVKDVRSEVGAIGPDDSSKFLVDNNLSEGRLVAHGFENRAHLTLQFGSEVDIGDKTIGKGDPKTVAAEVRDTRDVVRRRHGRLSPARGHGEATLH